MIYAFFPIIAAIFYGMAYPFIEKSMESINVATYIFWSGIVSAIAGLLLWQFKNEPISLSFLSEKMSIIAMVLAAIILPTLGWLLTIYSVKTTSAGYTVFAEISYPLFTLLFLFLFFGVRHFDWSILAGGALVMLGSFILIYGQLNGAQK